MYDNKRNFKCAIKIQKKGFTLIELLVVTSIISLLISVSIPAMSQARRQMQKVACASNLRTIGIAVHSYAEDFDGMIPFGPEAPPPTATNFYPSTGMVTSLLSLENGEMVGLGLLLNNYLTGKGEIFFCPAVDQKDISETQLKMLRKKQAQGDYYYRHASVTTFSSPVDILGMRLSSLGKNRNGYVISALAMDVQFLAHPALAGWGIISKTSHHQKTVNILKSDGRVIMFDNKDKYLTVDIGTAPQNGPEKILSAFEKADELQ
jgi:prepilin-type N-terminal cleavage/methylation domain-containing protein